ncbi:MAG TPA: GNAT family N-acetyltransferase [Pyrinomonadaceae bacterium]|jgi:GNAT superfamily N-acetyltransferase|nr:GNAT family N-acetyltransferase [Pyrinomonadaceae bacterium]
MGSDTRTTTQNLVIRHGKASDAAMLAELGARTFSETFAPNNSPEDMAAYLATAFSPAQQTTELADRETLFLIAESNGGEVGYAMLRSGNVLENVTGVNPIELVRLYVAQDHLGRGVGAALMQACIDEARRRGHKTLWLGVWEHNPRAQAFYRKWNFVEIGTHVFHLGNDPQTDLLMQRTIS